MMEKRDKLSTDSKASVVVVVVVVVMVVDDHEG